VINISSGDLFLRSNYQNFQRYTSRSVHCRRRRSNPSVFDRGV
jgi:hypothetical protein